MARSPRDPWHVSLFSTSPSHLLMSIPSQPLAQSSSDPEQGRADQVTQPTAVPEVLSTTYVGLMDLQQVETYNITRLRQLTSHFIRFCNGGHLEYAYDHDGLLVEFTSVGLQLHASPACCGRPMSIVHSTLSSAASVLARSEQGPPERRAQSINAKPLSPVPPDPKQSALQAPRNTCARTPACRPPARDFHPLQSVYQYRRLEADQWCGHDQLHNRLAGGCRFDCHECLPLWASTPANQLRGCAFSRSLTVAVRVPRPQPPPEAAPKR